jgi:hypothetical protein
MSAPPPKPPDKPQDFECCNRGCCPCIFDYYYDALERWETRVTELGFDPKALLAEAETTRPG